MGEGDFMPAGRHRRNYDPKYAKKIKEGGKKAEKIRKASVAKHQQEEVPKAEEELLQALEDVENTHIEKAKK